MISKAYVRHFCRDATQPETIMIYSNHAWQLALNKTTRTWCQTGSNWLKSTRIAQKVRRIGQHLHYGKS